MLIQNFRMEMVYCSNKYTTYHYWIFICNLCVANVAKNE